jgi:MYXO-CTERM domain-containing protein
MTRSAFAAPLAALLLAAPSVALGDTPDELATGPERAFQKAAVERALAQERAYTQATTVAADTPTRTAATPDDGPPIAPLAAVAAIGLLGAAAVARRRHAVSGVRPLEPS